LYLVHSGWLIIRKDILDIFHSSKSIGIRTLIDLLDNAIPAVLDIYMTLFRKNRFEEYFQTIMRLWFMSKCKRKNYDRIMLAFISDIGYWQEQGHLIMNIFGNHLNIIDEYPVENFHSLIRRYTGQNVPSSDTL